MGRATGAPVTDAQYEEVFLSTPSVGRATATQKRAHANELPISIHALRGEGDHRAARCCSGWRDFYPRPPWGGRRGCIGIFLYIQQFLSTPSVGRATLTGMRILPGRYFYPRPPWGGRPSNPAYRMRPLKISIHALRGEGDAFKLGAHFQYTFYFYPRPPWGGRLMIDAVESGIKRFLSTPSVGRATSRYSASCAVISFLSTPSVGRATRTVVEIVANSLFLSTPSVGRATR